MTEDTTNLSVSDKIEFAIQCHKNGMVDMAETLYGELLRELEDSPEKAKAAHFMGVLSCQKGEFPKGVELFRQAVALAPESSSAHAGLGKALYHVNALDEAEASIRKSISLDKGAIENHFLLAKILHDTKRLEDEKDVLFAVVEMSARDIDTLWYVMNIFKGQNRFAEAIDVCLKIHALLPGRSDISAELGWLYKNAGDLTKADGLFKTSTELDPYNWNAYRGRAEIFLAQGRTDDAIAFFRKSASIYPTDENTHLQLGNALFHRGLLDEALNAYRRALQLKPGLLSALINIGTIDKLLGRFDESEKILRAILAEYPANMEALSCLGGVLRQTGRLDEALECHTKAAGLYPNEPSTLSNMAVILEDLGKLEEAGSYHARAVALAPENPEMRFNNALYLLKTGAFHAGWTEYEWRWKARPRDLKPRAYPQPEWRGDRLDGRTLLLYAEQGYGDTLQFVRFASRIDKSGGTIVLAAQPSLTELLSASPGLDRVVSWNAVPPPFDVHLPLLSLPRVLGLDAGDLGMPSPYISVPDGRLAAWKRRLGAGDAARRIGVVWAGSKANPFRSLPLKGLLDVLSSEEVGIYSLQKDIGADDLALIGSDRRISNIGVEFASFADTAAAIACMDLVVTIDTAVAHLAGAMGKPTWTLLPYAADWRWTPGREGSLWYPSMRLFRQGRPGDWDDVLDRVARALSERQAVGRG